MQFRIYNEVNIMQRFILASEQMDTVVVREYYNNPSLRDPKDIICYTTPSKLGTAILIVHPDEDYYGFAYHSDLLNGYTSNLKFVGDTAKESVTYAMEGPRTVLLFKTYKEFIHHLRTLNQE